MVEFFCYRFQGNRAETGFCWSYAALLGSVGWGWRRRNNYHPRLPAMRRSKRFKRSLRSRIRQSVWCVQNRKSCPPSVRISIILSHSQQQNTVASSTVRNWTAAAGDPVMGNNVPEKITHLGPHLGVRAELAVLCGCSGRPFVRRVIKKIPAFLQSEYLLTIKTLQNLELPRREGV